MTPIYDVCRLGLCVLSVAALLGSAETARAASPLEDLGPPAIPRAMQESARSVLEHAFDNLYGCNLREEVEIEGRVDGETVRRHHLSIVRKNIDGRAHMLARFVTNNDYWDTRVLKIENHDRSDDHFMWRPALRRVRRMTSVQKADPFQGTDLTLEDLEAHRAFRFEIRGRAYSVLHGEPVHVLTIVPLYDVGYRRAILFVSQQDYAVLEAHYYRGEKGTRAYKVSRTPRANMLQLVGHVLPSLVILTDFERGTETWVHWRQRAIADDLDDRLFTAVVLETESGVSGFGN